MWRINNFPDKDKEKKLYIIFLEEKDTYEVIIKPLIDKVSLRLLISLQKLDLRYFNITVFFLLTEKKPHWNVTPRTKMSNFNLYSYNSSDPCLWGLQHLARKKTKSCMKEHNLTWSIQDSGTNKTHCGSNKHNNTSLLRFLNRCCGLFWKQRIFQGDITDTKEVLCV